VLPAASPSGPDEHFDEASVTLPPYEGDVKRGSAPASSDTSVEVEHEGESLAGDVSCTICGAEADEGDGLCEQCRELMARKTSSHD
jgi:hypothetical protein